MITAVRANCGLPQQPRPAAWSCRCRESPSARRRGSWRHASGRGAMRRRTGAVAGIEAARDGAQQAGDGGGAARALALGHHPAERQVGGRARDAQMLPPACQLHVVRRTSPQRHARGCRERTATSSTARHHRVRPTASATDPSPCAEAVGCRRSSESWLSACATPRKGGGDGSRGSQHGPAMISAGILRLR